MAHSRFGGCNRGSLPYRPTADAVALKRCVVKVRAIALGRFVAVSQTSPSLTIEEVLRDLSDLGIPIVSNLPRSRWSQCRATSGLPAQQTRIRVAKLSGYKKGSEAGSEVREIEKNPDP